MAGLLCVVECLYSSDAEAPWLLRQLQAPAQKNGSWGVFRAGTQPPFGREMEIFQAIIDATRHQQAASLMEPWS